MKIVVLLFGVLALSSAGFAADAVFPANSGTWSTHEGAGGGTISVARLRMGFDDDVRIPADYRVCNDNNSPTVTFEPSEKSVVVSRRIDAGMCGCFEQPEVLVFRNADSVQTIVHGTYEAYPAGSGCRGHPLAISTALLLPKINCAPAIDQSACKTEMDSSDPADKRPYCRLRYWNAVKCEIPLPDKRANYRLCSTANSLVRADGSIYSVGNASVVTDGKLANRFPLNSGGQPNPEYARMTGDCIDLFQIKQLQILIGPYPVTNSLNPYSVDHVDVQLQMIGQ